MTRPITPADSPTLVKITDETGLFKPLEVVALQEVLDDYHAANEADGHRSVIWEESGEIAGFSYWAPAAMTVGTYHLWWIVVRKDLQNRGLGKKLLAAAEDDIRSRGGRVLFIETGSLPHYEPTRQFYLKQGYEKHAVLRDFYALGDSMVVFRKEL